MTTTMSSHVGPPSERRSLRNGASVASVVAKWVLDAGHAAQSAAAIEVARRLPDDGVLVAVNALGLWLFDPVDHAKLLDRYARNEVCSWARPAARGASESDWDVSFQVFVKKNRARPVSQSHRNIQSSHFDAP